MCKQVSSVRTITRDNKHANVERVHDDSLIDGANVPSGVDDPLILDTSQHKHEHTSLGIDTTDDSTP